MSDDDTPRWSHLDRRSVRIDGVRAIEYADPGKLPVWQLWVGDEPLLTTGKTRRRRWWRSREAAVAHADSSIPLQTEGAE